MIRNLVFDMGNVLIHFNPRYFVKRLGAMDPHTEDLLVREVFGSLAWSLMDWGAIDEAECERRVLLRLPQALWETARQLIHHWTSPIVPMEGMESFVHKCKEAGYGIFLLSNASRRLHTYWPDIPASGLFDGMVVSADLQCVKPMPEIYRHLLEKYNLIPEECLFIDDMAINVAGAMQVGMQGFVFHKNVDELDQRVFGVPDT